MGSNLSNTGNFIHTYINEDLKGELNKLRTRFPPEPNGYLHIGHAKSICLNFGLAEMYEGKCSLRFDDTNPAKEDVEYVNSIKEDIKWLGFDWEDRLYFASDYFDLLYEYAVKLIKKGKAYVCDLTAEEIKSTRGTLSTPGQESPYRERSVAESLDYFERMKNGEYKDGAKTLRAKIDMSSPNINMRDPVIYRIAHLSHHNTGDKWCIYPMYDYAHPLEDMIEKITHSICTLEFEDHRPLYDWFIDELMEDARPRQIEFAKLQISDTIMGKRYMKDLVEKGEVDGWDDPRLATICGIKRRGYTPEAVKDFCDRIGVAKANSTVDYALLEHCVREDLKTKASVVMAVLKPLKVVITNYPEDEKELLEIENNQENPDLGKRKVSFTRELYIERDDFMENAPKKYHRLDIGREVRLKGAYLIMCNEALKDADGNVTELRCTYDPETKSGTGISDRKVKGTIHWVSTTEAAKITVRLYESLVRHNDKGELEPNPNSLEILTECYSEPFVVDASFEDRYQFMRNGYFCLDTKYSNKAELVFNRIVSLRSSYKP